MFGILLRARKILATRLVQKICQDSFAIVKKQASSTAKVIFGDGAEI